MIRALVLLLAAVVLVGCNETAAPTIDVDLAKKTAGELRDHKLYTSAIEEYRRILDLGALDRTRQGNITYLVARVYYDDLKDYRNAAAWYVRARMLDPNASYVEEASRNLVACLEKLGQTVDANRELRTLTDIDAPEKTEGEVVVAKVGDTEIYLSEIEDRLQQLPPQVQKQYQTRQSRIEFMHQMAGMELLYRAALREGYDSDPEILKRQEMLIRSAIIDRFVVDKVMPEVSIDSLDVRNYYKANRETAYNGAPYDSVRAQVFLDYQTEKASAAYNEYINRLAEAERLEFYDQNVR